MGKQWKPVEDGFEIVDSAGWVLSARGMGPMVGDVCRCWLVSTNRRIGRRTKSPASGSRTAQHTWQTR